ncbi:MAG: ribonuclease HII [Bacteroidota bacterium]|nr:ribonuclease HII [Bacteroidota bacterium]
MLKPYYDIAHKMECGCDEAGRGCLAGGVFAAAVILPKDFYNPLLNDSKQLSDKQRRELRVVIEKEALAYSVCEISNEEIDKINILAASIKAMNKAVFSLKIKPDFLLIDGNRFRNETNIPYKTIVKGDATYMSIAAASILAKTYRDDAMILLHKSFPQYYWNENKGYPTAKHRKAIEEYGISPLHRKTFNLIGEKTLFD